MPELLLYILIYVWIYVSILYIPATILKNWSIIDIAWGPGFLMIAIMTIIETGNYNFLSLALLGMTALWAIRLALHIGFRNIGQGEDFRYANWRKKWIPYPAIQGYFRVFILQGTIMSVVATPLILGIQFSDDYSNILYHIPGLLIFLTGFVIEVIADRQLKIFKSNPENKSKLIDSGLWSISRHPNYLGEIILWWGFGFMVLPLDYGYVALAGPLCIHLIIRYISIPVLEEKWQDRNDWEKIRKKIPILFPGIQKSPHPEYSE